MGDNTNPVAAPQHASASAIAAGTAAPQSPPASPPEPAKPQPPNGAGDTPEWLPERLAQAQRTAVSKLLSTLGVKDEAELKSSLSKLVELEKANMTEAEKRQAELDALKPKAARAAELETFASKIVGDLFAALPEAQQQAIDKVAQGNAEQRWQLMQLLRDAGPAVTATPAAAHPTPPVSTTPAGAPPPPANPAAPQTAFDIWTGLRKTDPTQASLYYQMHAFQIQQSKPAETG